MSCLLRYFGFRRSQCSMWQRQFDNRRRLSIRRTCVRRDPGSKFRASLCYPSGGHAVAPLVGNDHPVIVFFRVDGEFASEHGADSNHKYDSNKVRRTLGGAQRHPAHIPEEQ